MLTKRSNQIQWNKNLRNSNKISRVSVFTAIRIQLYCGVCVINLWKIVIFPMNINFAALSWHLRLYRRIIKKFLRHFQFLHMQHLGTRMNQFSVRFEIVFLYSLRYLRNYIGVFLLFSFSTPFMTLQTDIFKFSHLNIVLRVFLSTKL